MAEFSQRRRDILICLCLAMAIAAVYWPVRHFGFISYDDPEYITKNPHVQGGLTLQSLFWAFSTTYFDNWHPLTWLSHMLDCQLFGLHSGSHHLVSVSIHIANTLLLFMVLQAMTTAPWRSAFAAALFALHPLHVESVVWLAERKNVLCAFFWLLTMWAYVRYVQGFKVQDSRFKVFYGLALLFFTLGLIAKQMVVTLPFVLLLLDYWPLGRTRWLDPPVGNKTNTPWQRLVLEKVPFFVLAGASCAVIFWLQYKGGEVNSLKELPVNVRVANTVVSYVRYLGKTFWPSGLAVFYPYEKWSLAPVVEAGAVLFAVSACVIWKARHEPQLLVGWLWFLGTLVPVIGLVQVAGQSMADRYMYLPSIGLMIMLCWSVPCALFGQGMRTLVGAAPAVVLLSACGALCRLQVGYWRSSETLFQHAVVVTTNNPLAQYNLGVALMQTGKTQEAIGHYEEALRILPNYPEARNNLAAALLRAGRAPEAMTLWEQGLRFTPKNAQIYGNLGAALLDAGKTEEAIGRFEQALRLNPNAATVHFNLGLALERTGRSQEAIGHYEQALRIKPGFVEARNALARLQPGQ